MYKVNEGDMSKYQQMKLNTTLCMAAERGHVEYITHFLRNSSYPVNLVKNEKDQNLLQIAVECHHHKVYNLIHVSDQLRKKEIIPGLDHSDEIQARVRTRDQFGNNLLHTVASITPLSQIDHIQGTALQMQRELQWFKVDLYFELVTKTGSLYRLYVLVNKMNSLKQSEKAEMFNND
ncbi:hypothetical protein DVH24_028351 [Malus domestica]|uniref:Uncharacterized protein n=1 Tax=Malus domestica TaxID=3750 RepID=A0A498HD48_MALDO|nr:hypothetical protein DVH24_028351 [Malus domestica]